MTHAESVLLLYKTEFGINTYGVVTDALCMAWQARVLLSPG